MKCQHVNTLDGAKELPSESRNLQTRPVITRSHGGWTKWLIFTCFSVVFGSSFTSGILVACMNRNEEDIELFYNSSATTVFTEGLGADMHWGFAVAIYSIGAIFGSMISGPLSNYFGRRNTLLMTNIILIISSIIMLFATSPLLLLPDLFVFGRFIIGVYFGIAGIVAPMYLVEISPTHLRGTIGSLHQIGFNIGVVFTLSIGLPMLLGPFKNWPYLFGIFLAVAPVQLITLPFAPKSPRYLAINLNDIPQACEALKKLRGPNISMDDEIQGMQSETANTEPKLSIFQVLTKRTLRKALILALCNQIIQQTNGMVIVLSYSNVVFDNAGLSKELSGYGSLGTGLMFLIVASFSACLIDRLGRRFLYLSGLAGQSVAYGTLTLALVFARPDIEGHWSAYVAVISMIAVLGFVAFYVAIGWFITSELFTQGPRPAAMSIAMITNRMFNFYIALIFPLLWQIFKKFTFLYFAVSCAVFWVFVFIFLPETKRRTFEEIYLDVRGKNGAKETNEDPSENIIFEPKSYTQDDMNFEELKESSL